MSEVMKIQETIEKVRETASLPDLDLFPGERDSWYSMTDPAIPLRHPH